MAETRETPTCECVVDWEPWKRGGEPTFCGKVAVLRYAAMGGVHAYLCLEHGKDHREYAEPCYDGERA